MMRVTMMLADAVQAVNGKLYILGGGWDWIQVGSPMAMAIRIEVPWDQTNIKHKLELKLIDSDGRPVMMHADTGEKPVEAFGEFEVGRPPGISPGTPISVPLAMQFGPLPLQPNNRYVWHLYIDGETRDDWRVAFSTVATKRRLRPGG